MTLKELIDAFRSDVSDESKPYLWSDSAVTRFINEAEEEACIRARLIFDKTTTAYCQIDVVADTQVYAVNAKVIDIDRAYLISGSRYIYLDPYDYIEQDRREPTWREQSGEPNGYMFESNSIELNRNPSTDYTMMLEVRRLPAARMPGSNPYGETPEIGAVNHIHLLDWVKYLAFSQRDKDSFDDGRANYHKALFTRHFGERPPARMRRDRHANHPHRNKGYY